MITANANWLAANTARAKRLIFLFEIAGYSPVFTWTDSGQSGQEAWITKLEPMSQTVSALEGTSQLSGLAVTVLDKGRGITADFPTFIFEGKAATLKAGFAGLSQADFVTLATVIIDSVDHSDRNNTYIFRCRDNFRRLKRVIWRTADDGRSTSRDHPKTLDANPMDILLEAIQTEAGLSAGQINTAKITGYKDGLFAGVRLKFSLSTAPECKQFIDREIFKALGGYSFIDNLGRFTPIFLIPWSKPTAALTLTTATVIGIPEPAATDLVNLVTYRLDHDGQNFGSELTDVRAASVTAFGIHGQQVIESRGLRRNFGGWGWARMLANTLFLRHGGIPQAAPVGKSFEVEAEAFWDAALLEPGDFIRLTHALIPNRAAGTMGMTNRLFEVLDRGWEFTNGKVKLRLLDADWLDQLGYYQIALDTTPAWTGASAEEKATYMFVSDEATGNYSDASPGHAIF